MEDKPASVSDPTVIIGENQRLQKEVAVLRERVEALERSRWWRLHPRFVVLRAKRLARRKPPSARIGELATAAPAERHPLDLAFDDEIGSKGTFSETWFYSHVDEWEPLLRELDGRPSAVLEIGSYEGLSASYVLWRLREAVVTCVDTFEGSPENIAYGDDVADLESRFDANVALVDPSRVRKVRGDSRRVLLDLGAEETRFDLVYVDGSHHGLDVIVDAALTWQLLCPGGIVIFDDYRWSKLGDDPLTRPGPAVDAFLELVGGHGDVLFRGDQVAIRKLD